MSDENNRKYFVCETNKNPLEYKSGENMIFKLKVARDDVKVPFIKVKCSADDGKVFEDIIPVSDDGFFYINTSCERDGFVRVFAEALDKNNQVIDGIDKFEGGACADAEKIALCTDTPDDYFDYWENLKRDASEFPKKLIYQNDISVDDNYVITDCRFQTKYGKFLSLITTYPKGAKPHSLGLMMLFMGHGVASAPMFCTPGYMVIGVNSHDVENLLDTQVYKDLHATTYKNYGFVEEENKSPVTSYWNRMYFRNLQAFSLFKDHELLNKKDYVFVGGSQGAMQACNMALHTGYATECRISIPWCCDLWAQEKQNRMRGWRPDVSCAMNYFDTALAASHLKCPVYIEAGLGDYICPPSGQMAMYNAIKSPKMIRFVQNRTHSYRPPNMEYITLCDGFKNKDFYF